MIILIQFFFKEITLNRIGAKKVHQKIDIAFIFMYETPKKSIGAKFYIEFNFAYEILIDITFNFKKETHTKFTKEFTIKFKGFPYQNDTFRLIKKTSTLEAVFEFFHPDPQLVQILKHTRNLSFFYICIGLYMCSI